MKKKSKRYYGMTIEQLGMLGGAAVLGLLVIGIALIVVLMPPAQAQLPAATEIILPTQTPAPTIPVDTPTPTPTLVIATSVPPGGWLEFTTPGLTLWLPVNFIGGDLVNKKTETMQKIARQGQSYKNVLIGIKNATDEYALWMVDKAVKQSDIITTITARHIISTEDTSLDQYIKDYFNGNENGTPVAMLMTVNETKKLTVLGREAKRLTYNISFSGHGVTGLVYYIKNGADIWLVDYRFSPNNYVDMLPICEQSIQTLNFAAQEQ